MTVKRLKELLQRFDDQTEIVFEFTHLKSRVIPGSVEKYTANKAVVIDAVKMDGCIYIATGDS